MGTSVLEQFLILFDTNSEQVEKASAKAKKVVDDLEGSLSATDRATEAVGSSFMSLASRAVAAISAVVSVGAVMNAVFDAARVADRLDEASQALDISVENLSAWGDALQKEGGSIEGFVGDLTNMAAALSQIDITGKSRLAPFLKELGISATDTSGRVKETIPLLYEIADAFDGMSKQETIGIGRKLGLSMPLILLLQQGRRGVEEIIARQKELGVVTEKQARIAAAYGDTIDDTSVTFRSLYLEIGERILPAFIRFMELLQKTATLARENGRIIVSAIIAVALAISARLVPAIAMAGWNLLRIPALAFLAAASVLGFGGAAALAAANIWAMLAPLLLATAIVVGLTLVIEDLWSLFQGGPSLIGDLGKALIEIFGFAAEWVKEKFNDMVSFIAEKIQWLLDKINAVRGFFGADAIGGLNIGAAQITGAGSTGLASQTGNTIGGARSSNKSVAIGEVNIQTQATDANGIAQDINKSLTSQMSQTVGDWDDGVLA